VYLCVWASDFGCHGDTRVTSLLAPPPFCFFFIRWWMISIGFKRIEINWIKPPWIYKFLFEFFLVFCFDSVCFAVYVNIFRLIISVVFFFLFRFLCTHKNLFARHLSFYISTFCISRLVPKEGQQQQQQTISFLNVSVSAFILIFSFHIFLLPPPHPSSQSYVILLVNLLWICSQMEN